MTLKTPRGEVFAHGQVVTIQKGIDGDIAVIQIVSGTPDLRFSQPLFYVREGELRFGDEVMVTFSRRRWDDGTLRQKHTRRSNATKDGK